MPRRQSWNDIIKETWRSHWHAFAELNQCNDIIQWDTRFLFFFFFLTHSFFGHEIKSYLILDSKNQGRWVLIDFRRRSCFNRVKHSRYLLLVCFEIKKKKDHKCYFQSIFVRIRSHIIWRVYTAEISRSGFAPLNSTCLRVENKEYKTKSTFLLLQKKKKNHKKTCFSISVAQWNSWKNLPGRSFKSRQNTDVEKLKIESPEKIRTSHWDPKSDWKPVKIRTAKFRIVWMWKMNQRMIWFVDSETLWVQ